MNVAVRNRLTRDLAIVEITSSNKIGAAVRKANFWAIPMGFCYGYGSYFFFAWFPN